MRFLYGERIIYFEFRNNKFYFIDDSYSIKVISLDKNEIDQRPYNNASPTDQQNDFSKNKIKNSYQNFLLWNEFRFIDNTTIIVGYRINMKFIKQFSEEGIDIGGVYNLSGINNLNFKVDNDLWSYRASVLDLSFITIFQKRIIFSFKVNKNFYVFDRQGDLLLSRQLNIKESDWSEPYAEGNKVWYKAINLSGFEEYAGFLFDVYDRGYKKPKIIVQYNSAFLPVQEYELSTLPKFLNSRLLINKTGIYILGDEREDTALLFYNSSLVLN